MLADHLRIFRSQIEVFKGQHRGVAPGYPNCDVTGNPTEAAFITYMTMASDSAGATAAPGTPGYRYGPYLREIPENSVNGLTTVQMVPDGAAFPGAPDDSHGWVYQPSTNTFKADTAGSDGNATPYFDY